MWNKTLKLFQNNFISHVTTALATCSRLPAVDRASIKRGSSLSWVWYSTTRRLHPLANVISAVQLNLRWLPRLVLAEYNVTRQRQIYTFSATDLRVFLEEVADLLIESALVVFAECQWIHCLLNELSPYCRCDHLTWVYHTLNTKHQCCNDICQRPKTYVFATSIVTGHHRGPKWKLRAGYRAPSLKWTSCSEFRCVFIVEWVSCAFSALCMY